MKRNSGNILFVILISIGVIAVSVTGYFYWSSKPVIPVSTPTTIENTLFPTTTPNDELTPEVAKKILPLPDPTAKRSLCNCSLGISSGTNVEFLVTSSSGLQTGYLVASKSYLQNIPTSSYGVQHDISDDTGRNPPMPDITYFGLSEGENGIYTLQIIGRQPGKYHLDVGVVFGPGNSTTSADGTLTTNQVDNYTLTIPSGVIQKVNQ